MSQISQRDHLKRLVGVSYGLASDYIFKNSNDLNQNEKTLLKTVGELALNEVIEEETKEDELQIEIFSSSCFLGSFPYSEIFKNRSVITQGTAIEINEKTYAVNSISLTADRQIKMEVFSRVNLL
ncbi:hypothetical protein EJP82_26095 [Paenibacillus anaericanus]|uniref:Uncharacterized protein n=1 Tax=Paenibacillus anaericanus TaxID=170367 RepID=A0A3S1BE24_9BACL|nr:hypothetical protein [Paenibacillus anaericanus]RUT39505.1 hypothetical protein EJP82_26095 [Paenibacillus anaericanus]